MNAPRTRYAMTVDTRLCVGCKACVLSCKAENAVPDGFCRDWIVEEVRGEFPVLSAEIRSERCNHCSDAPCVKACPTGASHVNEGGVVLVTHGKCSGCKACIAACPYDARFVHPKGYVDKCTFCLHRVRKGLQPGCLRVLDSILGVRGRGNHHAGDCQVTGDGVFHYVSDIWSFHSGVLC